MTAGKLGDGAQRVTKLPIARRVREVAAFPLVKRAMDNEQALTLIAMIRASQEFERVITPLHEDLQYHAKMLDTDGGQFWRRGFVRALFAFIEGAIYGMKQIAFVYRNQTGVSFSLGEQAILAEESYELNDKGDITIRGARLQLYKNIKFSFRAYAKAHMAEYEVKVGDEGWESFRKGVEIRDRLTHPKASAHMFVSDDEAEILRKTYVWFEDNLKEIQQVSYRALEQNLNELQNRLAHKHTQKPGVRGSA
jgi:hypothetical protein